MNFHNCNRSKDISSQNFKTDGWMDGWMDSLNKSNVFVKLDESCWGFF